MSFILDVILPRNDIDKLGVVEELVEWGGEKLSQIPPQYSYKSKISFHESVDIYYQSAIENFDAQNFIILTLDAQYLSEMEYIVNNSEKDITDCNLLLFMEKLYNSIDVFYVFMYRDEECIDNKYVVSNVRELIKIFCNALRWSLPEGVVIVPNKN